MTTIATSFELLGDQDIPELNSRARLYRHIETGAEILSLENDDENKVFGVAFRTPPADSTGVAHILEHSVLCGSRKYPSKEPFVELLKGSLKTFLNAMTYPDKTCYPVASQNVQDFYNLVDVYLDAVFFPRITPQIFAQEGWHYELDNLEAPLIYKGVVFNEMKGAYASPDGLLREHAQQSLFPDTTYGVDAGGHPQRIPDLTYAQFKQFHETLYHPSNARFFFYGDDDPETRLSMLYEYLREFKHKQVDSAVRMQAHFAGPRHTVHTYPVDQDSAETAKSQVSVNWLLPQTSDPRISLELTILSHILVGTPAAPLRKALLDSGLGEDLTASGYTGILRQGMFMAGLKGINAADADQVERLIMQTLADLADGGIDPDTVEASVNTLEFRLRENNTGSAPRGLLAMIRALTTWLHDEDPFAALAFDAPLNAIKARLAAGEHLFEGLIRTHLLDNSHRTVTLLNPDPEQAKREADAERLRLEEVRAAMSEAELQAIMQQTEELKRLQETPDPPEVLAMIPSLTLHDLDTRNKDIPLTHYSQQDVRVLYHDLPTSDIIYMDLGFDLHTLPQELLPYVPLFARALLEMGTEKEDYVALSQRIGRKTGGISTNRISSAARERSEAAVWLLVRARAVPAQTDEMLGILRDMLLTLRLDDRERFRQIVLKAKAGKEASMVPSGHSMVNLRLRGAFNEADWADEQMGGVSSLFFLRQLVDEIERDWPAVQARLEQIRSTLLKRGAMICNVTVDEPNWKQFAPRLDEFLAAFPATPVSHAVWTPTYSSGMEGLTIPAQVNYVGKATNLFQHGYVPHGSLAVINKYLRTSWLWEQVRVKGGAYGVFCTFDRYAGVYSFLSYRDPNLIGTLDVYDRTAQVLREVELGENEVVRSIIGAISDIDSYQLPDAKGYSSMVRYLLNETDEIRQQWRDDVLSTTEQHFRAFADMLDVVREHGMVVVMGSGEAINAANAQFAQHDKPLLNRIKVL